MNPQGPMGTQGPPGPPGTPWVPKTKGPPGSPRGPMGPQEGVWVHLGGNKQYIEGGGRAEGLAVDVFIEGKSGPSNTTMHAPHTEALMRTV